jgi:hypothetical protein
VAAREREADRRGRRGDRARAREVPALPQDDNSVLFGLSKRLAPARRALFLVVLVLFILSLGGSHFERTKETEHDGVTTTTRYTVDLDSTFLSIAPCSSSFFSGWSSSTRSTTATS